MTVTLKPTHRQFRAALAHFDRDQPPPGDRGKVDPLHHERRKVFALWWFIENVAADDPACNDIFFELRTMVRS